ncbi:MAG: type II toxin-antitoxin system HicB family antitoxin [Cyanobium sp.]
MSYRIRLLETEEGWSVSCLDLPGCHSQGESREEALANIREAIALWLEVEAEEAGVKQVETSGRSKVWRRSHPCVSSSRTRERGNWASRRILMQEGVPHFGLSPAGRHKSERL